MSLLKTLPYSEYKRAKGFKMMQCETIARLVNIKASFHDAKNPGEYLLQLLDRHGCSVDQYIKLVSSIERYRPQSKVALLIANDKYQYLTKLATPSMDCDSLGINLRRLGFIVCTIKNTTAIELKMILTKLSEIIPEDSYCLIFYAGHGFQICNIKYMLGIDCPLKNIQTNQCMTENYLLKSVQKCKLDLCIFIMDMCRMYLEKDDNPEIYASMTEMDDFKINKNLVISYSTQSSHAAYEVLELECSKSFDNEVTYELKTGDSGRIVPGSSQYVNALCTRITENCDVGTLLDKVHYDVENSLRKQRPIKVQCGTDRRYLFDSTTGNIEELREKFKKAVVESLTEWCNVF